MITEHISLSSILALRAVGQVCAVLQQYEGLTLAGHQVATNTALLHHSSSG